MMFSSPSYAEWRFTDRSVENGDEHFVDFESIRKKDGYVYYWNLNNYGEPDDWGNVSNKIYFQGDCSLMRNKALSIHFHKQPMGWGTVEVVKPDGKIADWNYLPPESVAEVTLKAVCQSVGK